MTARNRARRWRAGLAAAASWSLALALHSSTARADEDHRLVWSWRRFERVDFIYTTAIWASLASVALTPTPRVARWEGGILFDDVVRDALVYRTARARAVAGLVSDILWVGTNVNVWAESTLVPLATDRWNTDVAFEMTTIGFETFAPVTAASLVGRRLSARARPSTEPCRKDPSHEPYCGRRMLESFPSGHTATSFVSAALSCANHRFLPLYGGGLADDLACGALLTAAATSGFLRIASDRHYASDVLIAAALGLVVGYGVPTLLHYDMPERPTAPATGASASPVRLGFGGAF